MTESTPAMTDSPILAHYATGHEASRLDNGAGKLERARTEDILTRYLPPAPAVVLDIGGGPGRYAGWLASRGYTVHLIDAVSLHVEQARESFRSAGLRDADAEVGDARALSFANDSADAALLLGPLYHLPDREDRLRALREARRVLKPGGRIVVAVISRFASLLDGLFRGFIRDPQFVAIVDRDLQAGRHENRTSNPHYFTTAYLHRPEEIAGELDEAGFVDGEVLGVEGPFWCLPRFDEVWSDAETRGHLLTYVGAIEREPSLLGSSAHLIGLARAPR